jgi:DNA polymerase (family 10)
MSVGDFADYECSVFRRHWFACEANTEVATMQLRLAQKIAEQLVVALKPLCVQIHVAGSIRRCRPECGDIDFVVQTANIQAFKKRCLENATMLCNGEEVFRIELKNGVQVDFYFARLPDEGLIPQPTNFGSVLLCRTGSASHNIYLVEHAKRIGLSWHPHQGVFNKRFELLASATEQEIFAALQLDYVPPEVRE